MNRLPATLRVLLNWLLCLALLGGSLLPVPAVAAPVAPGAAAPVPPDRRSAIDAFAPPPWQQDGPRLAAAGAATKIGRAHV